MKKLKTRVESLKITSYCIWENKNLPFEKQLPNHGLILEENGTILGQKVTAVDKIGLYIPR